MKFSWLTLLFIVASLYDAVLGVGYFLFYTPIYHQFGIALPNDPAYVQFPALLLIIFALMFLRIATNPEGNRALIGYGMGLKIAYSGIVFSHQLRGQPLPPSFVALAWIDVAFLVLFIIAFIATARKTESTPR